MPRSPQRATRVAAPSAPASDPNTAFAVAIASASRETLDRWSHDASLARDEARNVSGPGELSALQVAWAAEAWGLGLQAWSRWLCAVLDGQSACWRDAEALTQQALQPWQNAARTPVAVEPLLELPQEVSPCALAQRSASLSMALFHSWTSALRNDLQAAGRPNVMATPAATAAA